MRKDITRLNLVEEIKNTEGSDIRVLFWKKGERTPIHIVEERRNYFVTLKHRFKPAFTDDLLRHAALGCTFTVEQAHDGPITPAGIQCMLDGKIDVPDHVAECYSIGRAEWARGSKDYKTEIDCIRAHILRADYDYKNASRLFR